MSFQPPARLRTLAPSQIRENMRLAKEVGAINLAQGRPDFPTHPAVKRAAQQAIEDDHNQYSVTWGVPALREAVSEMLARRFGLTSDPDVNLTITCGVTEGIVATMMALVEEGDEVVIIEPAHENYVPAVRFAGGTPRYLSLEAPDFALTEDALAAVVTDKTRAIVLNTPHNPSGRVFTSAEIDAVLHAADKVSAYVVTDEIYDHLTYPGHEHVCPATRGIAPERVITTGGISKIYAVTGWRLGYVVAPDEVSAAIRTVHDYLTICAPTPLQHAALAALALPDDYYADLRRDFLERRARMMIALRAGGFDAREPEGAYYVMASFDRWGTDEDDVAFTRRLIQDAGVAVVPGTAFYLGRPELGAKMVRFAFAKTLPVLDDVARRLGSAFRER